ncbi:MAG: TraE/TraK family type IV conjugative transfer system protein [Acinetobacter sp.]|uniref:TraE/TraK family type IV conjugative transfer system protein n=1 Tax=Acinetobacter sp. TaxID=472 RepID=UPI002602A61C|nr:TraE/TraK family type IV conjugative transfer system protein [Acinetobacter sp.]MDD2944310.1 TraE/TraK family type IV conjugative transfer system protein [Acinetobacter sp.]
MRYSIFNMNWSLSHKIAVGGVLTSFVLSIVVLIMAIALSTQRERIVLVPPTIDQQYQINWDSANAEYYQSMALVASGLVGSTTPKTLTNNLKSLNQFLSPALQRQMEESLNALSNKLPKENFNAWFIPKNVFYEKQTNKIFVQGALQSSLVSNRIQEQPVVYEFIIRMVSGKPVIVHFNSYEGTRPLTLAQIRANEAAAQQTSGQAVNKPQPQAQ